MSNKVYTDLRNNWFPLSQYFLLFYGTVNELPIRGKIRVKDIIVNKVHDISAQVV